jgi:hypothetical protein
MNNMKHKSSCLGPNFDSLPMRINASPSVIYTKIQDLKALNFRTYPQMLNLKPFISDPKT